MAKDLNKALEAVEMTYGQIKEIADSMLAGPFEEPNRIVEMIQFNIESMSIEMLRDSILRLQLAVYSLSELRDRSGIKAVCAEAAKLWHSASRKKFRPAWKKQVVKLWKQESLTLHTHLKLRQLCCSASRQVQVSMQER